MSTLVTGSAKGGPLEPEQAAISPRRAQTREKLLTAATAVFAERGINAASVEEIAAAADFTRGAFYSNFADKSELVLALIQHRMAAQFDAARAAIATMETATETSAEERMTLALTLFEQAGRPAREGILLDQELELHAAREPELHAPYLAFLTECDRQLAALVLDALDHLGLELTVPFDQAVRLLAAVHQYSSRLAVFSGTATDPTLLRTLLLSITRLA